MNHSNKSRVCQPKTVHLHIFVNSAESFHFAYANIILHIGAVYLIMYISPLNCTYHHSESGIMKKKTTIQDIADALGISRNTVSKAINNSGGLADETREKILQKAVEMGYKQFSYVSTFSNNPAFRPASETPREMPVFRGELVLLTTKFLDPSHFASLMLDRFQRDMAQLGYTVNTHRVTQSDLKEGRLPITLFLERCSGIICFEIFDRAYAEMLCSLEVPILFVDAPAGVKGSPLPADQLYMDSMTGVTQFVNIMLKQGVTKIGWIGDYDHCQSFRDRYVAYRLALLTADVPADDRFIIRLNDVDDLTWTLHELPELPEVFICANDFVAQDAVQILTDMGYKVPDDVKICGFDDSPASRETTPKLTTVHIHTQVMAFSAVHLIVSRMEEPSLDYRTIYTEATLILRESTGPVEGGNK